MSAQEGQDDRDEGGEEEDVDRAAHDLEHQLADDPEDDERHGDPDEERHVDFCRWATASSSGERIFALRMPAITTASPWRKWSSPREAGSKPATNTCFPHRPITSATRGQRSGSIFGPIGTPSFNRRMISSRRVLGDAWSSSAIPVV